ncbi:MAG: exosortase/archaeosortase family protein [Nitrospirota bacterium]|nr:exosortase/archaeosortase family protein [Nitrospirota bacterium]
MTFFEAIKIFRWYLVGIFLLLAAAYYRIVPEMVNDWYRDENYSHGFLVPLIAGYFAYERREALKEALISPWGPGLLVILYGLFQLIIGFLGTEYFTMRTSLIIILAGMVLYFFGREVFRHLLLPIGYLFLMVPIPYIIYDAIAFPLKLFITKVSVGFLKLIGVIVMREGNIIVFPMTTLEVADACSGIRSLVSLIALAVAYAFFIKISNVKRWIIIVSAVPIAIATNATRVIVTGILAQFWGAKAAEGFFHEFAGMMVFALAMVMLVALGALLKGRSVAGEEK